jgi:hypothetical protein
VISSEESIFRGWLSFVEKVDISVREEILF